MRALAVMTAPTIAGLVVLAACREPGAVAPPVADKRVDMIGGGSGAGPLVKATWTWAEPDTVGGRSLAVRYFIEFTVQRPGAMPSVVQLDSVDSNEWGGLFALGDTVRCRVSGISDEGLIGPWSEWSKRAVMRR